MTPILLLALPTLFAGWWAQDLFFSCVHPGAMQALEVPHHAPTIPPWLPYAATAMALLGLLLAWLLYGRVGRTEPKPERGPVWQRLLYRKLYIDEVWLFLARKVFLGALGGAAAKMEKAVVGGAWDWLAGAITRISLRARRWQSGQLQTYGAYSILGFCSVYLLYLVYLSGRLG